MTLPDISIPQDGVQAILLKKWQEALKNPQWEEIHSPNMLSDNTQHFFQHLLSIAGRVSLPAIPSKSLEPVFKFWHHILKDYARKGMTLKDMTMMVVSLKTTLLEWQDEQDRVLSADHDTRALLENLVTILDFLGVLTFEIFSRESAPIALAGPEEAVFDTSPLLTAKSPQMQAVYQTIALIVDNDMTVLLEGETGVGKDVVASIIHRQSKRNQRPFVTLNCGAIPKELIESELFGHEKGAFTGAEQQHLGKFELADKGTLFLDEIGELSLELQVKLLRVLQNREIERVGGTQKIGVDVRVIAATNKELKKEVDSGRFRKDLYYRIHVFPIRIPPLRERKDDIVPLALYFLESAATRFSLPFAGLREDGIHYLLSQPWDGNVRELENTMQRALVLSQGTPITATILAMRPGQLQQPLLLTQTTDSAILPLDVLEKQAIAHALVILEGNVLQAAKKLGISRTTLYQKAKKYGIELRS